MFHERIAGCFSKETYTVNIERDAATGTAILEEWSKNGKFDRADGPAYIERDAATRIATYEAWFKDGKLDRADGPAVIRRDTTGKVTMEAWLKDGVRIAPPAGVSVAPAAPALQP